jgi:endonuclease YncB( thermonuclease family)
MRTVSVSILLLTALFLGACDTRPTSPAFNDTTTTSTTLPGIDEITTTTVTLPPPEVRVVGTVLNVNDGDTLEVLTDGSTVTIRLLGVNAPELSECWGEESMVYLSNLIANKNVLLVNGPEGIDVDPFGRLLRYLYLEDEANPVFINARLVESGHAIGLQDGSEIAGSLKALEARAFQSGYGMWATYACGDLEGVGGDRPVVRISELEFDPQGPDAEALDGEYITVVNEGYDVVEISGWTLRDESTSNRFRFPANTILDPGEAITVVTGCDGGPQGSLHWCSAQAVWSNGGDTAIIADTLGNAVVWYTYGEAVE